MFFMGTTSTFLKLCMPLLLRRFDHLRVFAVCTLVWPLTFALMPALNAVARQRQSALLWAGIRLVLVMSRVGTMVFSIVMILVRETAPGPASLGTTNVRLRVAQRGCYQVRSGPTAPSSSRDIDAYSSLFAVRSSGRD
ncbi:hypothetical protein NEOLEDRAFT_837756 [Neolentinus lepideus HHB14362 ss-1]|uniref:Uncharacterized protein n=1 Tax=Neolentinus lepideus HHB14362 ss-1 TaxID=1314782 RepID=A0A165P666_9AGAM|nr:hypothetical protein NEOLEDRAFT_837756 [Neolentinus lepideus HHB14362 ss-1]